MEQFYINGVLQVRGTDYVATTGTSITSISPALVLNDIATVISPNQFNVANTYTIAQTDSLFQEAYVRDVMDIY